MKETALLAKAWTADARTKPICVHLLLHSFYRINEHLRQFMSRDIQQPSIPNYMSKIMEPQKPSPLSDVTALQKSLSDYKTFLAETLATMKIHLHKVHQSHFRILMHLMEVGHITQKHG